MCLALPGLIGVGLVLSGLGALLTEWHFWCWLGFHAWVATADTPLLVGTEWRVVHICRACGRRKTFRLPARGGGGNGN